MNQQKIKDVLTFLQRSKSLQSAHRYGSSLRGEQNTVAEHSWRLGLMAFVIGSECKIPLDMTRTLAMALIHDLGEAKTGDIDAYTQIKEGKKLTDAKAVLEDSTVRSITDDLSFGDQIYTLWREFEDQITLEAKFIKALDRIEGFLHIAEGEVAMYIPKEFHADYATKAVAAFDEATQNFSGLKDLLDAVKEDLKAQFEKTGVAWIHDNN